MDPLVAVLAASALFLCYKYYKLVKTNERTQVVAEMAMMVIVSLIKETHSAIEDITKNEVYSTRTNTFITKLEELRSVTAKDAADRLINLTKGM